MYPLPMAWMTHLQSSPGTAAGVSLQPAAEGFVMVTLATLFFTLGCFLTWMWVIWQRGRNPPPHVRLLMELAEEEERETQVALHGRLEEEKQPWERGADWWREPQGGGRS